MNEDVNQMDPLNVGDVTPTGQPEGWAQLNVAEEPQQQRSLTLPQQQPVMNMAAVPEAMGDVNPQEMTENWRRGLENRFESERKLRGLMGVALLDVGGDEARALADREGYVYHLRKPETESELATLGRDYMQAMQLGDMEPLGYAQQVIAQMPDENKRAMYQQRVEQAKRTGKDTQDTWYALIGEMFRDDMQDAHRKQVDEQKRILAEMKKGREDLFKELNNQLPQILFEGRELPPEMVAKLSKYDDTGKILESIKLARTAGERLLAKVRGGRSKAEWEADVLNRVQELKEEWQNSYGMSWNAPKTEADFLRQALADESNSYQMGITRGNLAGVVNLLRDKDGKVDAFAMDAMVKALRLKAESEQGLESAFFRNFFAEIGRFGNQTLDEFGRQWSKIDNAVTPYLESAEMAAVYRQANDNKYNPDVETLRSKLMGLEDTRLEVAEDASLMAKGISDVGTIAGGSAPYMALGLGWGALAAAPSLINRQVAQAYEEGKSSPELYGMIRGGFQAAAEGFFAAKFAKAPVYTKAVDWLALKALSLPKAGRLVGRWQGNALGRLVGSTVGESLGELVAEDLIADGFTWATVNGLRRMGVNLDEEEFAGISERLQALDLTERQNAATVAYCVVMGLAGAPAHYRAARAFASSRDNLEAAGIRPEKAVDIVRRVENGTLYGERLTRVCARAIQQDVFEDPVGAKYRFGENEKKFLSDLEARALMREKVMQASLKEAGIVTYEPTGEEGMFKVNILDYEKLTADQKSWEKGEDGKLVRPEGYETPTKEVEFTGAQLAAYAQYHLSEREINRMRVIRSQAFAKSAAKTALSGVIPLSELGVPALDALAKSEGAMTLPVLKQIAKIAGEAQAQGREVMAGVSNRALMRLPQDFERRLDEAVTVGELTQAEADAVRRGERPLGASAVRVTGEDGESRILINDGLTTTRGLAEDALEKLLHNEVSAAGGEGSERGQALIRQLAGELAAARQSILDATGQEVMPEFDPEAVSLSALTEIFSHFAQSEFYQTADARGLSGEALMAVQFMDSALMTGRMAQAMKEGYAEFAKTEAGQNYIKQGGALSKLMEAAGMTLKSIYETAEVTAENLAAVMEARAIARGDAEASIAEVVELAAEAHAEMLVAAAQELPSLEPEESASPDVGTQELAEMFEQERAPLNEEGNIKPQTYAPVQESADGLGRSLKGGEYVQMGDGSVLGSARVEDIHLSPDVPQFKRDEEAADIEGDFRADAAGYLPVWRRKDGRLELITGRRRLALAQAKKVQDIAVRVYDEDASHDARWARLYDAEENIEGRSASVEHVAYFFRETGITDAEAEERGLMPKKQDGEPMATLKMGVAIARKVPDDVFARFMSGNITAEQAYFVATLGEREEAKIAAARKLSEGKDMEWTKAYASALSTMLNNRRGEGSADLFGYDNSWVQEVEKLSSYVESARKSVELHIEFFGSDYFGMTPGQKMSVAEKYGLKDDSYESFRERAEEFEMLDARLEAMDSELGLGARAAAWDGKSPVDVDELRKAGWSTFSLALDNGVGAFMGAMDVREEVMERMLNSVKKAAQQWAAPFKGTADDRMKARGSTLGLMMGIYRRLPQGYMVQVTPLLRRAAVLERMIATGKLTSHGQISKEEAAALDEAVLDRLDEGWAFKLGEAQLRFRKGENGQQEAYVSKAEQRRLWKEAMAEATEQVGREGMEGVYRELAAEVERVLKQYLHDMEMARMGKMLTHYTPKVNKATRKLNKGKYGADFYKEVDTLRGIMGATAEARDAKMQELMEKLEALEAKGELTAEDEQQKESLDAELADWMTFGALASRSYMDVRVARLILGQRAAAAKEFWTERTNETKARLQAVMASFRDEAGGIDEGKLKRQEEWFARSWRAKAGDVINGAMSAGQLMYTLETVPGLGEYAIESVHRIAAGNINIARRAAEQQRAMDQFLIDELGLLTESARNDWGVELNKLYKTDIKTPARTVTKRRKYTIAEAEEWLAMTPEQREAAREEWKKNPKGKLEPLPEWATPALQAAYDENMTGDAAWARKLAAAEARKLEGKPGKATRSPHKPKAAFMVEASTREEGEGTLELSKNQALNIILLSEQPRYKGNAELQGYTDEVLQELRDFVGADVLAFGYWMRDYMGSTGLAEVYEAREGVPFPAEENYWTGRFDLSAKLDKDVNAFDASVAGFGGRYGILKTRVDHNLSFDLTLGATNVFMGTMAMQNNYICMGGLTAEWRSMLSDQQFARNLREKIGESRFHKLKEALNILDMQGLAEATSQQAVSWLIGAAQGAKASVLLSAAPITVMKQASAVIHAVAAPGVHLGTLLGEIPGVRRNKGRMKVADMLRQEAFAARQAHNKAKYDVFQQMLSMGPDATYSKLAGLSRKGMNLLEHMDVFGNAVSATALYNATWRKLEKARKAGRLMTDEQMHEECMSTVEIMLDQAMMPTLKGQQSMARVYGGGMAKQLFFMQGELLNKTGIMVRDFHRKGGGPIGFFLGAGKMAWSMSMADMFIAMLIDVVRGPSDDEELDWSWAIGHFVTGVSGMGFLQTAPLMGELFAGAMQGIATLWGGGQRRFVKTDTFASALGVDVTRSLPRLWRWFTDDKERTFEQNFKNWQDMARLFGGFTAFGGGVNSTFKWWSELSGLIFSANTLLNVARPVVEGYDFWED